MQSVSFILCADGITLEQLRRLSVKAQSLIKDGLHSEFLLYAKDYTTDAKNSPGVSIVHSNIRTITALQKAIVSACGDVLVFTTPHNVITDEGNLIFSQAAASDNFSVAVPEKGPVGLRRIAGIRHISNMSYWFATKEFSTSNSELMNNPKKAITQADKQLSLLFIPRVPVRLPDVLLRKFTFSRPYVTLVRYHMRSTRLQYSAYRKRRKDYKLSLGVPPVHFNRDIPIFIICRDRVEPLRKLIAWLESEGLNNIFLIDNASTYPPLLSYYESTPYELIKLGDNIGHTSPWKSGIIDIYAKDIPYIVTDPDVIPSESSHGAVKRFCELLTKYPERRKVGFGLKIDDLPDHYDLKKYVISWEKQFWVTEKEQGVYDAEIDTTFAVYRQNTPYILGPGLRTGGNLVARHEPWYINSKHPTQEIKYYRAHADKAVGSWGVEAKEATDNYISSFHKSNENIRIDL